MVGQVLAAAAPAVIQSASTEGSLIDRLLKIVTIVAILGALIITGVIIVIVFNVWEAVGGTFETVGDFFKGFRAASFFNPVTLVVTTVTSIIGFNRSR